VNTMVETAMHLNRGLLMSGALFVLTTLSSILRGALLNPIQMQKKEISVISIFSALIPLDHCSHVRSH
jgi:hypothetical protein